MEGRLFNHQDCEGFVNRNVHKKHSTPYIVVKFRTGTIYREILITFFLIQKSLSKKKISDFT